VEDHLPDAQPFEALLGGSAFARGLGSSKTGYEAPIFALGSVPRPIVYGNEYFAIEKGQIFLWPDQQ
jgi:hypothetical protein